jgi:uncharacterized protein YqjF (DUF2071 family)
MVLPKQNATHFIKDLPRTPHFLTAQWQDLVMVNYTIKPEILQPFLPRGTALELHEGLCFISLVAFRFNNTKLFGAIPSYPCASFDEVNLRYYIIRDNKRAVAFVKEIVPSRLIAYTAQLLYNEPYVAMPMRSVKNESATSIDLNYEWGDDFVHRIAATATRESYPLVPGSVEEFILEHYWGYTAQPDGSTVEYNVTHPRWRFHRVSSLDVSKHIPDFYGAPFKDALSQPPHSVFVAAGSDVSVSFPRKFFYPLPKSSPQGWLLCDDSCGFCRAVMDRLRDLLASRGFIVESLQTDWVAQKLASITNEANNDTRLLLNDGTLINGADAYLYLMKHIWWTRPFALLFSLPLLRQLIWIFYRLTNQIATSYRGSKNRS